MRIKRSVINCSAGGLVIMAMYFAVNHSFDWGSASQLVLHLSNACSIAGMLLILFAGFGWLQKEHMMDWAGYALYQARFLLLRHKDNSFTNFYDYRNEKGKEYQNKLLWPRFWVGLFYLALGVLFSFML